MQDSDGSKSLETPFLDGRYFEVLGLYVSLASTVCVLADLCGSRRLLRQIVLLGPA